MARKNQLFTNLDFETGFTPVAGKVAGIEEKILADDIDHEAKRGKRTRLLRLAPGVQTPAAHDHPFWEELYVFEGSMVEGTPESGERHIVAPSYACREPGFMHGPIRTDEGCIIIEFNWYDDAERT